MLQTDENQKKPTTKILKEDKDFIKKLSRKESKTQDQVIHEAIALYKEELSA